MTDEDEALDPLDEIAGADDSGGATTVVTQTEHRRRQERMRAEERELKEFWQSVFASPIGRKAMWAVFQMGHRKDTKFACGPTGFPHPEATWFHAGEQALADRIYGVCRKYARDGVLRMEDELDPDFMPPLRRGRKVKND